MRLVECFIDSKKKDTPVLAAIRDRFLKGDLIVSGTSAGCVI
jgi:cyanophycinase-like exopeptidase